MRPAIFLIAAFLSACSFGTSSSITATPLPTRPTLKVALTPTLRPLQPALNACAEAHSEVALVIHEQHASALDLNNIDFVFHLGETVNMPPFAFRLAVEQIEIVVHQDNPISHITLEEIQSIYTGATRIWKGTGETIEVWVPLEGSEVRSLFENIVLDGDNLTPYARLAPFPEAMLTAISQDPNSIGVISGAWLENQVKPVQIEQQLSDLLKQPVLALSKSKPKQIPQAILHCMQSGIGQTLLQEKYQPKKP